MVNDDCIRFVNIDIWPSNCQYFLLQNLITVMSGLELHLFLYVKGHLRKRFLSANLLRVFNNVYTNRAMIFWSLIAFLQHKKIWQYAKSRFKKRTCKWSLQLQESFEGNNWFLIRAALTLSVSSGWIGKSYSLFALTFCIEI